MTDAYRLAHAHVTALSRLDETDSNLSRLIHAHQVLDFERERSRRADVYSQFNPPVVTLRHEMPEHLQ